MELSFNEFVAELEETTIEKVMNNWEKKVSPIIDKKLFYATALKLTVEELMEANYHLLAYGKIKSNFEEYLLGFAKNYTFIGRIFKPKTYRKPLVKDGIDLGVPVYYDWCKNHRLMSPPEKMGVYHLFFEGVLVYIGFSRNIKKRLNSHYFDKDKPFDAVLWFFDDSINMHQWLEFEKNCIKYWKPSLNKNYLE